MKSGVYKILNIKNGKFYIGSSKDLNRRKTTHFYLLRKNSNGCRILQNAFNKYGEESFTFEVLAYCPIEYLFKLEQWFVDNLKPQYNCCLLDVSVPIGLSGKHHYMYTDAHREIKKNEAIKKLLDNKGFGWKSQIIEKLDDNNNVLKEYPSLKAYALEHKCSIGNVGKALKNNNRCKGFYIRYKKP